MSKPKDIRAIQAEARSPEPAPDLVAAVEGLTDVALRYPESSNGTPLDHEEGCAYAYGNLTYPCRCFVSRAAVLALLRSRPIAAGDGPRAAVEAYEASLRDNTTSEERARLLDAAHHRQEEQAMSDKRHRRKIGDMSGKQPHYHPQPGPQDGRGNCPACADYNPEKYGWAKR